jgi:hypothetical protein
MLQMMTPTRTTPTVERASHPVGDVTFIITSSCSGEANLSRAAFRKSLSSLIFPPASG